MTTIGILGGTGSRGRGLARRFAQAGDEVSIGCTSLIAINRRYHTRASIMITDPP
jgi:predicted dinucleotide-binding enzyme